MHRFFLVLITASTACLAQPARVDSLNALGRDYIFSHIAASIDLYTRTIAEARELGYRPGEARAHQNLGIALYLNGRYDASVDAYLQAIRLFEALDMRQELAQAYGDLGYQMKRRDLERARIWMRQGIAIAERHNFQTVLSALYDNYGVLQEMSAAPDSARHFYRKALDLKTALNDTIGIPFSLNNLAGIFAAEGDFARAGELLTRSDRYRNREPGTYGRLINSVQWGDLYFHSGRLDSAEARYRRTITMPGADEQNYLVSYCYNQLTALYEQRGDFRRAFENQKRFSAYRDSLVNVQTHARIAALEIEYETEKKDRLIAQNQLQIAARDRQVILLAGAVIILAIAGMGIYRFQRLKRRQIRSELELRNRLKQAEFEQHIADEKLRISRELHDNIGAQLTFLIGSLDNLAYRAPAGDLGERLATVSGFGRDTLNELRHTVWAMKHEGEGFAALAMKLNELKRQFAETGQPLDLEIDPTLAASTTLSSIQMLNLFRIAQEAVQNAVKHAGATRIRVGLAQVEGGFRLTVSDDGGGFDVAAVDHVGGLTNMRQRCLEAGGEFGMRSGATGTVVSCTMGPE